MSPLGKRPYSFRSTPVDYYKAYKFMRKARTGAFAYRRRRNPVLFQTLKSKRRRLRYRKLQNIRRARAEGIHHKISHGTLREITLDSNGEYQGLLYCNPLEESSQWPAADYFQPETVLYDQYKISKITWSFWLPDTANYTVSNRDDPANVRCVQSRLLQTRPCRIPRYAQNARTQIKILKTIPEVQI